MLRRIFGSTDQGGCDGLAMQHIQVRREMHKKFGLENMKERDHLEHLGKDGRIMLK
jgi:hypothetical protein